jgi:type IV pilus assembly protein PilZ
VTERKEDTRRFRRRTVRILVDYVSDRGVRCDYATTLGAGGLFVETEEPLPAGARMKLRFRLPGGELLHEIEGRVTWSRTGAEPTRGAHAPGMGIQFTNSAASSKLARELEDLPSL